MKGALRRWRYRLRKATSRARGVLAGALPDVRDVHVYGGAAVAGYGLETVHGGVGCAFAGIVLIAIGLGFHVRLRQTDRGGR